MLDLATITAIDTTNQVAEVLAMPEHLRDAVWRVDSAGISSLDAPGGLVIAGMGGSAVGARLAVGALGDRATGPIRMAAGYSLPGDTGPDSVVLCASYSGHTEETLSCYDQARALGAQRLVVTTGGALAARAREDGVPVIPLPGGFQPRAAVGYATVVALEAARLAGVAPALHEEIEAAAVELEARSLQWGPVADSEAKDLALALHGTIPVVVGAELTAPVAYRWKCQFNENAKLAAFSAELPEADHNEICGWAHAGEVGSFSTVFIDDPDLHPRNRERIRLTAEEVGASGLPVHTVAADPGLPLARLMSMVLLGDLLTIYVAVLRGVDPADIAPIERLKAALG